MLKGGPAVDRDVRDDGVGREVDHRDRPGAGAGDVGERAVRRHGSGPGTGRDTERAGHRRLRDAGDGGAAGGAGGAGPARRQPPGPAAVRPARPGPPPGMPGASAKARARTSTATATAAASGRWSRRTRGREPGPAVASRPARDGRGSSAASRRRRGRLGRRPGSTRARPAGRRSTAARATAGRGSGAPTVVAPAAASAASARPAPVRSATDASASSIHGRLRRDRPSTRDRRLRDRRLAQPARAPSRPRRSTRRRGPSRTPGGVHHRRPAELARHHLRDQRDARRSAHEQHRGEVRRGLPGRPNGPGQGVDRRLEASAHHLLEDRPGQLDVDVPPGQEHRDDDLAVQRQRLLGQDAVLAQAGQRDGDCASPGSSSVSAPPATSSTWARIASSKATPPSPLDALRRAQDLVALGQLAHDGGGEGAAAQVVDRRDLALVQPAGACTAMASDSVTSCGASSPAADADPGEQLTAAGSQPAGWVSTIRSGGAPRRRPPSARRPAAARRAGWWRSTARRSA